jgi:hypothetical protein
MARLPGVLSGEGFVRTVAEYRAKAKEFQVLADETITPALKKRYADMAECYRLLAEERERLVKDGTLPSD